MVPSVASDLRGAPENDCTVALCSRSFSLHYVLMWILTTDSLRQSGLLGADNEIYLRVEMFSHGIQRHVKHAQLPCQPRLLSNSHSIQAALPQAHPPQPRSPSPVPSVAFSLPTPRFWEYPVLARFTAWPRPFSIQTSHKGRQGCRTEDIQSNCGKIPTA